jgi:hypothetical protein
MSPFTPSDSLSAQVVRWSAGNWKIVAFGLLALVAAAFAVDNLFGATYLQTADFQWDLKQLLDLDSTSGIAAWLPMSGLAMVLGLSADAHTVIVRRIRSLPSEQTSSCSCR